MDVYRELLIHPEINTYLSEYPECLWSRVISSTLKYGISSLKSQYRANLPVEMLDALIDKSRNYTDLEENLPQRNSRPKEKIKVVNKEFGEYSPKLKTLIPSTRQEKEKSGRPSRPGDSSQLSLLGERNELRSFVDYAAQGKPEERPAIDPPSFGYTVAEPEWISNGTQTDKVRKASRTIKKAVRIDNEIQPSRPYKEGRAPFKQAAEISQPNKHVPETWTPSRPSYDTKKTLKKPQRSSIKPPTQAQIESAKWVGDYSNLVRVPQGPNQSPPRSINVPQEPSRSPSRSVRSQRPKYSFAEEDSHVTSEAISEPREPLMPHWHDSSSNSDSSMSAYHPAEELRHFYKGVYDTLLDSQGMQSEWSSGSSQHPQFGEEPYRTY